ncbi:MAG: ABC transporter permease [Treponema sp.]|nr:ABC transporter permease [Treponema sp.]
MKARSSFLYAKRILFPKSRIKSQARMSIIGSIICIALSVIPLISVTMVSDAMFTGMTERLINLSSSHIQAVLSRQSSNVKDYKTFTDYAKTFLEIEGVKDAYAEIDADALSSSKNFRTGAKIRAVERRLFQENEDFKRLLNVKEGDISLFQTGKKVCIIGEKISESLGIKSGDSIRLITSSRVASFKVASVVSSGYQELDSLWVFIPLDESFSFLAPKNSLHSVFLKTESSEIPYLMKIQEEIDFQYAGRVRLYRWDEVNSGQFENFSSTKIMLTFIMALIVLVSSINISSALVMQGMERRKEIAILKSLGASSKGITLAFLITGSFCGLSGCLIALPIGLFLALNINSLVRLAEKIINFFPFLISRIKGSQISEIHLMDPAYYLQNIPVKIEMAKIFQLLLFVFVLSLLVSLLPSIKAGKERPLDTFRRV